MLLPRGGLAPASPLLFPLLPGQVSVGEGGYGWGLGPPALPRAPPSPEGSGGPGRDRSEEHPWAPEGAPAPCRGPPPPARLIALSSCLHSFRPALPVSYLQAELGFEGEAACQAFLEPLGLAYTGLDNSSIDCRLSLAQLPAF